MQHHTNQYLTYTRSFYFRLKNLENLTNKKRKAVGLVDGGAAKKMIKMETAIRTSVSYFHFNYFEATNLIISILCPVDQFKTAMTSEEKAKLYEAIGYHEDGVDLQLPENYVSLTARFNLKLLEVCVRNEIDHSSKMKLLEENVENLQTVLSLQVMGVSCQVDQRPAVSGLKLDLNMKEFTVYGLKHSEILPVVVKSMLEPTADSSLLDVKFEMNPLDKVREKLMCPDLYNSFYYFF